MERKALIVSLIKKLIFVVLFVWLVAAVVYFYFNRDKETVFEYVAVKRGVVVQEVVVTGEVKPEENADLAFERGGKIVHLGSEIGDKVNAGQILARLDSGDLFAQLAKAKANVSAQKAKLAELRRGAREEDVKISRSELERTEQDLANYYDDVLDVIDDAYFKSDDAVRAKTSSILGGSKSSSFYFTFISCDTDAQSEAIRLRLLAETELDKWGEEIKGLNEKSPRGALDAALNDSENHLNVFKNFLERVNDNLTTGCALADSGLDSARTSIATARSNVINSLIGVGNLKQAIASQKLLVQKIGDELDFKLAGASFEEIDAQEAVVEQAEAEVKNIESQIAKTIISSPIDGIVVGKEAEIGEIVAPNAIVYSVNSENDFKIEANVAESDIAKIKVGDQAKINFDAYGQEESFLAKIISIDPGEKIIEGVATYRAVFRLDEGNKRVKSGMTANIEITGDKRENVIFVPQRAIVRRNVRKFVRIINKDGTIKEAEIETGLYGAGGNVEIKNGLKEGDLVITFME